MSYEISKQLAEDYIPIIIVPLLSIKYL